MAERSNKRSWWWKALHLPLQGKRLRVRPQGTVTALEVDGNCLRLVQVSSRGSRTVVSRISAEPLDLPGDAAKADPAALGKAIAQALDRSRIRAGTVVMGVPRASVILRGISLPPVEDLRELAAMVHFQIAKDLPFRPEEAVIDFKVRQTIPLPSALPAAKGPEPSANSKADKPQPAPTIEVLVAVTRRTVVETCQQAAAAAGLRLAGIGLLSQGNARCLEACRVAQGAEVVALVTLRPDEVGIDVVAQQSLLFSRGASLQTHAEAEEPSSALAEPRFGLRGTASDSPADAPWREARGPARSFDQLIESAAGQLAGAASGQGTESGRPGAGQASAEAELVGAAGQAEPTGFVELVTIEVVRSLHSYGGLEPNHPLSKVVVVGATGHEPAVVQALQERLNLPVTWLDVGGSLDLPRASREHAAACMATIGLALGATDPQGLPFDFLHPKRPPAQRDLRRTYMLMGTGAAAALVVFLLAVQRHLIRQRDALKAAVQMQVAQAAQQQPLYRQTRQQAVTIQQWSQGPNWLEHYAHLSAILPPSEELYLTSFSVSGANVIHLTLQARSGQTLANVVKQLQAVGYEVKPGAVTPAADRYGYGFRSSLELVVPPKLKIDLAKLKTPARPADDASLESGRPSRTAR